MVSLSRQLARWVVGLPYDDLPPAVVDRAKGVTLHSLASVLLGSEAPGGQQAVQLITAEESGVGHGATIMVYRTTVTRGGGVFTNAEMAMAGSHAGFAGTADGGTRRFGGISEYRRRKDVGPAELRLHDLPG